MNAMTHPPRLPVDEELRIRGIAQRRAHQLRDEAIDAFFHRVGAALRRVFHTQGTATGRQVEA